METRQPLIKAILWEMGAALVGAVTLAFIGSLVTLGIALRNVIINQPFQWSITTGIGLVGVVVSSVTLVIVVLSARRQLRQTRLSGKSVHTGGKYWFKLGINDAAKLKPRHPHVMVSRSKGAKERAAFMVRNSSGKSVSTISPDEVVIELTMDPAKPLFITISVFPLSS